MRILVWSGDGIGPEIVAESIKVLEAADKLFNLRLKIDYEEVGLESLRKYGTTLRDDILETAKTYDGLILGPQSHSDYPSPEKGGRNISAALRVGLDLYANVRPSRSRPFLSNGKQMDLIIMREATEGFYPDRNMHLGWGEMMPSEDMALSVRKITAHCSERIARRAFEMAMTRRKKVTAVHKVNSFHMTDGLFLRQVRAVAQDFPEVELNDLLVDASAAYMVRDPSRFDVIVTTNLYGDILSDLASELSGSLGLGGSIMAGDTFCCAQAQHGSAPDIQGQNKANPTSMILSVAMLIRWLGEHRHQKNFVDSARRIEKAVDATLRNPSSRTPDIGGASGTRAFGDSVVSELVQ